MEESEKAPLFKVRVLLQQLAGLSLRIVVVKLKPTVMDPDFELKFE